jgi:hypothetical protein
MKDKNESAVRLTTAPIRSQHKWGRLPN